MSNGEQVRATYIGNQETAPWYQVKIEYMREYEGEDKLDVQSLIFDTPEQAEELCARINRDSRPDMAAVQLKIDSDYFGEIITRKDNEIITLKSQVEQLKSQLAKGEHVAHRGCNATCKHSVWPKEPPYFYCDALDRGKCSPPEHKLYEPTEKKEEEK